MSTSGKSGALVSLHRYPVKSMMGEELNAARVGARGIQGDRAFALLDPETGKIVSAKNPSKWPTLFQFRAAYENSLPETAPLPPVRITLPDGGLVSTADGNLDQRLSSTLGKPVRFLTAAPRAGTLEEYWPDMDDLAHRNVVTDEALPAETFFDLGMIHLLTTTTLDSLRAAYPAGRFEPRRFRPNLIIETPPGSGLFPENDWHDRVLAIGAEVQLKITGPCGRCVMTTLAQGDLPKDPGILKTAVKQNQGRVGVYASVLQGGVVRMGDPVHVQ